MIDIIPAMKMQVVALEGVFDTGLACLLDTFDIANALADTMGMPQACFDVTLVGVRRRVCSGQGWRLPVRPACDAGEADVLLVPALGAKQPTQLRTVLARRDVAETLEWLREQSVNGTLLGAACTGSFVLAASGLLDGQSATTSWWLAPLFRELHPQVHLDEKRMLVASDRRVTAGAALAHLDLALWMVRQVSPALAALTARYLVLEPRPSQAGFVVSDHLAHADPVVERFEGWARANLSQGFSLCAAAAAAHVSERTLARRLQKVLGKTPLSYFQDLRVEQARHLLDRGGMSLEAIASEVGYADATTLRTLLRRRLGVGVRALRQRT